MRALFFYSTHRQLLLAFFLLVTSTCPFSYTIKTKAKKKEKKLQTSFVRPRGYKPDQGTVGVAIKRTKESNEGHVLPVYQAEIRQHENSRDLVR